MASTFVQKSGTQANFFFGEVQSDPNWGQRGDIHHVH